MGIHGSGIYYNPILESDLNLDFMRFMDAHYLDHPFKGAPQVNRWIIRDKGYQVNGQTHYMLLWPEKNDHLASLSI